MARTTAAKAGGLDLLDLLYRNQILVYLVMNETDRGWLARITARVRELVESEGVEGAQAERLKHWTYFMLENQLADRIGIGLEKMPSAPDISDQPLHLLVRTAEREINFASAAFLLNADVSNGARGAGHLARLAIGIAEVLKDVDFRAKLTPLS